MFPFEGKKEHANILLRHDGDGEAGLDGLGVGVLFGEFLRLAFEVGTCILDIVFQLLVHAMQALVIFKVVVLDLGVEMPGVGLGALHADMEAVVLDDAGERAGQTALADEFAHGLFYLRAQSVDGSVVLVGCRDGCKHLVDD